jgi:hypothetical protein
VRPRPRLPQLPIPAQTGNNPKLLLNLYKYQNLF